MICLFSIYLSLIFMVLLGLIALLGTHFWVNGDEYRMILVYTLVMFLYILLFPIILSIFTKMVCANG